MTNEKLGEASGAPGGDIASALGANASDVSTHVLSLYIPNKDRDGKEFGTQRKWLLEAAELLAKIGGGFTIMPPVEGGWVNDESAKIVWENPVVIYTYVKKMALEEHLAALREFLHRMGRDTHQGEVALEYNNTFYRITAFDQYTGVDATDSFVRRYNTSPF